MILCFLNLAAFNNELFLMNVCMGSLGISLATGDFPPVFLLKRMMNWLPTGCFPIIHSLEIHCYLQLLSAEVCPLSQLAQFDRPQEDVKPGDSSQQPTSGPRKSLKSCFHKLWQCRPPPTQPHLSFNSSVSSEQPASLFLFLTWDQTSSSLYPLSS